MGYFVVNILFINKIVPHKKIWDYVKHSELRSCFSVFSATDVVVNGLLWYVLFE